MAEDKMLTCRDCGSEYTFTSGEQEFYTERGFSDPIRCKSCRDVRKAQKSDRGGGFGGGGFERSGDRQNRW